MPRRKYLQFPEDLRIRLKLNLQESPARRKTLAQGRRRIRIEHSDGEGLTRETVSSDLNTVRAGPPRLPYVVDDLHVVSDLVLLNTSPLLLSGIRNSNSFIAFRS